MSRAWKLIWQPSAQIASTLMEQAVGLIGEEDLARALPGILEGMQLPAADPPNIAAK